MGQISMEITPSGGSVLDGRQHLIDQSEGEGHTDRHVFALGVAFELAHGIDRDGVEHPIRGRVDVDVLRLMLEAALTKDSFYICV